MSIDELDLAGQWEIRPDPRDAGLDQKWFERAPADGWRPVSIGCAWQYALGGDYHGVAWYRRRLRVPDGWLDGHSRIWLRFEAVATDCTVWAGATRIGRHVGDYLPFQFDITDYARRAEEIEITIRVDEIRAERPAVVGKDPWIGHITKGFHDVLSMQHGGIWAGVTLRRTGQAALVPDGVRIHADPETGLVRIRAELADAGAATLRATIDGPTLREPITAKTQFSAAQVSPELEIRVPDPCLWFPHAPALYTACIELLTSDDPRPRASDAAAQRFGFRSLTTGGPANTRILLNGEPVSIRGVLDWGHEPNYVAPAPSPDEVRARFAALRERGFNCVCLCMWYPPEWFFDIADETGMLIWQEHPVWKSDMADAHVPEYQRLFDGFFRRDRRHPSVVIVSGACEHERFNTTLAAWWWRRAHEELPRTLLQVQTAFFAWVDQDQMDLHDEHTYDTCGRWVTYLRDLQDHLRAIDPEHRDGGGKPFAMGETIVFTSWPDAQALIRAREQAETTRDEQTGTPPVLPANWHLPKGLDAFAAYERDLADRHGPSIVPRLRRQADRQHLLARKFQLEHFRAYPNHAALITNHLRDVPVCQCGFMDDLDRWRFSPQDLRPFLCDAPILLRPPEDLSGHTGGRTLPCRVGLSNFSPSDFDDEIRLRTPDETVAAQIRCQRGDVAWADIKLNVPRVETPTRHTVVASAPGLIDNSWDLWLFPEQPSPPPGVVCLAAHPFTDAERLPTFEEAKYSSGWGLPAKGWDVWLPDPAEVLPDAPQWDGTSPIPPEARVLVTHRLTPAILDHLESGGRVLLLASRCAGGLRCEYLPWYAVVPLVLDGGPLTEADTDWVVDLFQHDLTRRALHAIPTDSLGWHVRPIIRAIKTHDQGRPVDFDLAMAARVGDGLLVATALDHATPAGLHLLSLLLRFAAEDDTVTESIPVQNLRAMDNS